MEEDYEVPSHWERVLEVIEGAKSDEALKDLLREGEFSDWFNYVNRHYDVKKSDLNACKNDLLDIIPDGSRWFWAMEVPPDKVAE